jgi:transcriptional regulator with XRE-family HTH domain
MRIQETQESGMEMGKRGPGTHQPPAAGAVPPDAPYEAMRVEFARRLQQAMIQKGWHQSELARQASKLMPRGQAITRDMVSKYIRAQTLPSPKSLDALARVLGKKPDDMLPSRGVSPAVADHPSFDMRGLQDGNVWLRVNQAVSMNQALKIMGILKDEQD